MGTPIEVTPRRAVLQTVALLVIFYAFIYGSAALRGSASLAETNVVASVFVTGGLMLVVTALLLRRDADWRASLRSKRTPVVQAIVFGAVGVVLSYASSAVMVALYTSFASDLETELANKAQWASRLGSLPLYWLLPLSAFIAIWEEVVFRGFLLNRLLIAFRGNTLVAVLVAGVLFGLGHGYQGMQGMLQTTGVGLALGAMVVWRKSLWPAVIAHLSIDTVGLFAIRVLKPVLERLVHH